MSQLGDTPNSRTVSDHQEGVNLGSPSTNNLCIKLIEEFTNGRISKDESIQEISENQMHMMEFQPSKSKWKSPHTSQCSTKPGLLNRMQLNEGEDRIWDHLTKDWKSLEE